ncbi:MAG TPA: O-antigen ligase family protein [Acidiphilium sp.]
MISVVRRDPVRWLALAGLAVFGVAAFAMPTAIGAMLALAGLGLAVAIAFAWPVAAMMVWLILVETTPEMWLSDLIGHHELIIAVLKSAGLAIVAIAALRDGVRFDRFNPSWAFVAMFGAGLIHGLWPGLTLTASFRSLTGSSAPFAPGFLRMTGAMRRAIVRCVIIGPCVTVGFGAALAAFGIRALWLTQQGAIRLVASSSPAFLGGFAMIAIFAGLVAFLGTGRLREWGWIGVNFVILLASGARAPLVLAAFVVLAALVAIPSPHLTPVRRTALLALGGAGFGMAVMAASALHMIRAVDLIHLGEAWDLSNRNLIWPDFIAAIARSPVLGWGVGAGKVIVGLHSPLGRLLGTNAAHNEYLRIAAEGGIAGAMLLFALLWLWLRRGSAALPAGQRTAIRLVFLAFAVQSFTDNTLIATTSLAFFTWARAVFADAKEGPSTE